jgi:hypothetical protein
MTFSMKLTHENTHFIPTLLILLYCVFNVDVVLIVRIAQKLHIFLYIFLFLVAFLETHALTVARMWNYSYLCNQCLSPLNL